MIERSTDIGQALRHRAALRQCQRGFLLNPFRFGPPPVITYATWNPSDKGSLATLSNGNLTCVGKETDGWARSTIGKAAGKWSAEFTSTGSRYPIIGIATASAGNNFPGADSAGYSFYGLNAKKIHGGTQTAYGSAWTAGQVVRMEWDLDNFTLEFFKAGTSMGVAFTGITAGTYYVMTGGDTDSATSNVTANFGATSFAGTPTTGFNAGLF